MGFVAAKHKQIYIPQSLQLHKIGLIRFISACYHDVKCENEIVLKYIILIFYYCSIVRIREVLWHVRE